MDDYQILERLKAAAALDGQNASDGEWSELLAAALDAIPVFQSLLDWKSDACDFGIEVGLLD